MKFLIFILIYIFCSLSWADQSSDPTVVNTSISNQIVTDTTTNIYYTDGISIDSTINSNGVTETYSNNYIGSTSVTTTTTTTTPITTTTYSDGSTITSTGASSNSIDTVTTYSIFSNTEITPIYFANIPNSNSIYIKQINSWFNNQVTVEQDGNNNSLTGVQDIWARIEGNNNIFDLRQYGQANVTGLKLNASNNNIEIKQHTANGQDVNNNIIMLESLGNGNVFNIQQQSNNNSASIKVTNDINTLNLIQKTGSDNQTLINITGYFNSVNSTQNGSNNFALVNILGDQNSAIINQTGNGHSALINLTGNKNSADITQTGQGDTYSLQQNCINPAGCAVTVIRNK